MNVVPFPWLAHWGWFYFYIRLSLHTISIKSVIYLGAVLGLVWWLHIRRESAQEGEGLCTEWVGGKRSEKNTNDDRRAMMMMMRPVIVGFWELSVILSCHANFIKFIMVLHTFWCTPRGEGGWKRVSWWVSGKAKSERNERGRRQREHPLVHMKLPVYLRQYLVHLPEAVASQSVVIAPGEWSWLFSLLGSFISRSRRI